MDCSVGSNGLLRWEVKTTTAFAKTQTTFAKTKAMFNKTTTTLGVFKDVCLYLSIFVEICFCYKHAVAWKFFKAYKIPQKIRRILDTL